MSWKTDGGDFSLVPEDLPEEWLPVIGYEGYYEVSSWGRVRRLEMVVERKLKDRIIRQRVPGRIMGPAPNPVSGHLCVHLCKNGKPKTHNLHVLVALAFLGPRPDKLQVCHNDGNPAHNWKTNLRYDTPIGNAADRHTHGTHAKGSNNPGAKFNEEQIIELISEMTVKSLAQISRERGIHPATLSSIKTGANWPHLYRPWKDKVAL